MCMGIPVRLARVDDCIGWAEDGTRIDLALTGPLAPGTWVLNFLGAAREVLTEDEAQKIGAALDGLSRIMQGGELGDAFADLDRPPQLPPHLAAAQAAGKSTA